jgi:hypothetical protein
MKLSLELRMLALGLPIPAPDKTSVLVYDASDTGADRFIEALKKAATKHETGLKAGNQERQCEAAAKYQKIKAIARDLDPRLRRRPYVLARRVRNRLIKQGKASAPEQGKVDDGYSIKTIVRALRS